LFLGTDSPEAPVIVSQADPEIGMTESDSPDITTEPNTAGSEANSPSPIALPGGQESEPADEISVPQPSADVATIGKEESAPSEPSPSKPVYSVQVGAFRDSAKAAERVALLKKKGYDAYIVEAPSSDGTALRKVRVGNFENREKADRLLKKIRQKVGLQAFVTFR